MILNKNKHLKRNSGKTLKNFPNPSDKRNWKSSDGIKMTIRRGLFIHGQINQLVTLTGIDAHALSPSTYQAARMMKSRVIPPPTSGIFYAVEQTPQASDNEEDAEGQEEEADAMPHTTRMASTYFAVPE